MQNVDNIKSFKELSHFVDQLKSARCSWNRRNYYILDRYQISHRDVVAKVRALYHDNYLSYSLISQTDSYYIQNINTRFGILDRKFKESLARACFLTKFFHSIYNFLERKIFVRLNKRVFKRLDARVFMNKIVSKAIFSNESRFLSQNINTTMVPSTHDALNFAYKNYYSKPYRDVHLKKSEATWKINGQIIQRYNHGLAHATRKAFYIPFIVKYLNRNGVDYLTEQLEKLFQDEGKENVLAKLQLVMIFSVTGRESEVGANDNLEIYAKYLAHSAHVFKIYCKQANLVGENRLFKDEYELKKYSQAIKDKYSNRFKEQEIQILPAIVDAAHTLDLFRCLTPARMKKQLEALNLYSKSKKNLELNNLAHFCQRLIKITGDRLRAEYKKSSLLENSQFQRSNLFTFVYRFYRFSRPRNFVKCSSDSKFCWKKLQSIPHPLCFSKGETTYSYLKDFKNRLNTPQNYSNKKKSKMKIDKISKVSETILNTRAAIRLINTRNSNFHYEVNMLNDPVFFRPIRKSAYDRDFVLLERENKIVYQRGYKKRLGLFKQATIKKNHKNSQKNQSYLPCHKENERGLAKNSKFTKKVSLTLLRKDAKILHFAGAWPEKYTCYEPVGMLYDVDELNQKNSKFIFNGDASTDEKFWVGKKSKNSLRHLRCRAKDFSLFVLQNELNRQVRENAKIKPINFLNNASNEMLMGLTKNALRAIFSTEDLLIARIRTFLHLICLAQNSGVQIPMLIIDGKNPPYIYSQKGLLEDLMVCINQKDTCHKDLLFNLKKCFYSLDEINKTKITVQQLLNKCCELLKDEIFPLNKQFIF